MIPAQSVAQVFDGIQQVKAGSPDFCTNFFPVQRKVQDWIDHAEFFADFRSDAVFFFRKDRDLWHLYYCASSKTALHRELIEIPAISEQAVVLDIIGKDPDISSTLELWEQSGFRRYTRLFRMVRIGTPEAAPPRANSVVEYATLQDAHGVMVLLEGAFDRFGEQLPVRYEIEAAVQARQVLVSRQQGQIGGVLFFETIGFSSTLRFWAVAEEFRALRIGSALIREYFATQSSVKRFVLWVAADNLNAVQKYGHYGYKPDGLVDYVLVNQIVRS